MIARLLAALRYPRGQTHRARAWERRVLRWKLLRIARRERLR